MRSIRGLRISSVVILSPILLCMVSLISILFSTIIGWIIPTKQSFPVKTASYQRNHFILFKKLQSRGSSVTLVILFLYLFYILFKKKRNKDQQTTNTNQTDILTLEEENNNEITTKKKKNSKRRKYKKISKSNHQHHVHKQQHHHHQQEQQQQQEEEEEEGNGDELHIEQDATTTTSDHDEIGNVSVDNREIHINTNDKLQEQAEDQTPELTPIESEDEDQKPFKNWYSPFSTGLDLDILPKHISPQMDPLTLKYDTVLPVISHVYSPKRPASIEILENYPFIPSTPHHHPSSFTHSFGPIGHKKK